jgi:hypothetical protein
MHTKGPWRWTEKWADQKWAVIPSGTRWKVAGELVGPEHDNKDHDNYQIIADANVSQEICLYCERDYYLIQSAPEMYEALQAAQTLIRNMKQQFNCSHVLGKGTETIIEQALDKAEGRA